MAEDEATNTESTEPTSPDDAGTVTDTQSPDWRELWQFPAAVLGLAMIVGATTLGILTAPTPDLNQGLELAERQIDNDQILEAIETLNIQIWPHIPDEAKHVAPDDQRARYHQLLGRAIALGNGVLTEELEENHKDVRLSYNEALRLQAVLEPRDVRLYAESNAALGRFSEAVELADSLDPSDSGERFRIYRSLVERSMAGPDPQLVRAQDLLATMSEDPDLRTQDPGWVLIRQSEALIDQGYAEDAIFTRLAAEEADIRRNPVKRTTELLRTVFGS